MMSYVKLITSDVAQIFVIWLFSFYLSNFQLHGACQPVMEASLHPPPCRSTALRRVPHVTSG